MSRFPRILLAVILPITTVFAEEQAEEPVVREPIPMKHFSPYSGLDNSFSLTLPSDISLGMVWIAPGSFAMGSPPQERGHHSDEAQQHVTLTQGYWLGQTEVTRGQWEAVMGGNPSLNKVAGADAPVEQVSWEDAIAFCSKVNEQERAAGRLPSGYAYSLPTEAQWEYACRAGTTELYAGPDSDPKVKLEVLGWYHRNSGRTIQPVGQKLPNAWGLYDMHGNVYEWCMDWYGDYLSDEEKAKLKADAEKKSAAKLAENKGEAQTEGDEDDEEEEYPSGKKTDPTGAEPGEYRVYRGGSWFCDASFCRSANRYKGKPSRLDDDVGFRLALRPVQK